MAGSLASCTHASMQMHTHTQVWNHPWVLKLDEHRQAERAERLAMYGESEEEEDDDSTSLEGFIVSGSEEEEDEEEKVTKKKAKKKSKKYEKVRVVLLLRANH